jgi:hypothetical protein
MQRETNTPQGTMPFDRFGSVFRATRQKAAGGRQQRRHEQLIGANRRLQRQAQHPRTILPFHPTAPCGAPDQLSASVTFDPVRRCLARAYTVAD